MPSVDHPTMHLDLYAVCTFSNHILAEAVWQLGSVAGVMDWNAVRRNPSASSKFSLDRCNYNLKHIGLAIIKNAWLAVIPET